MDLLSWILGMNDRENFWYEDADRSAVETWLNRRNEDEPICVSLEMTQAKFVSLTQSEFRILQEFVDKNRKNRNLTPKDFLHLPKEVRIVLRDWLEYRKRGPK